MNAYVIYSHFTFNMLLKKMPSNLGFLIMESIKWFSKSIITQKAFKDLVEVMNPDSKKQAKPTPFQKINTTRWLVRGKVIYNIMINWEGFKPHFMVEQQTAVPVFGLLQNAYIFEHSD